MRENWSWVWNFKNDPAKEIILYENQDALNKTIRCVKSTLQNTFNKNWNGTPIVKQLTLVCITASTIRKNTARYAEFSRKLCSDLDMYNGYSCVSILSEGTSTYTGGDGNVIKHYDPAFFKEKYVVLFDDVRTRGKSLEEAKKELERVGATVICAITIAQTIE